jgi:ribose-phosphate pyrophosphokinase
MELKIFSGSSNPELVEKICSRLAIDRGNIELRKFPIGDHFCKYKENIRGSDVFLVQSIDSPSHERFMELCVMIDAVRRASAGRINVVVPFMGYLRQDRKTQSRTPITAKLAANMLTCAGAQRVIGMDFHCDQAQGFFDIPVDHLYAMPTIKEYVKSYVGKDAIILSPDSGGIKRAGVYAQCFKTEFGFIVKKRTGDSTVESQGIIGNVTGKDCIIIDDMTESCGTLIQAAQICKENGAKSVVAAVTHGLLNDIAAERLNKDKYLDELIVTNTVHIDQKKFPKVRVLDISSILSRAIRCINQNKSVSELFEVQGF